MTSAEILSAIKGLEILVIGDLMLDHYIWGDVHRISPEAPVPVIHAIKDTNTAGGAANVALNLAALGANTSLIGSIGQDDASAKLTTLLATAGIDTSGCLQDSAIPTIVKTRVVARNQQLCRIDREAPRHAYAIHDQPALASQLEAAVIRSRAIILSDYAKGVITQSLIDTVLALARKHGKPIAIDPKPARQLHYHGIDLITPNRHEALELARLAEPGPGEPFPLEEICRRIHETFSPRLLVITLGAEGMAICRNGLVEEILPTRAREVFDVSGAGDTVIATLTAALAAGASPAVAASFANLAAGIVVSKMGTATPSIPELLGHP
jgi:D-glycero-beta-D-manno-heptose-7-phosphate kinase